MSFIKHLYEAYIQIGGYQLHWLEIIGVTFGLASAVLGMRRKVWAWPIGIVGNALLFLVYITVTFDAADGRAPLFGQSGRQIFFILTSAYGWWRWNQVRGLNRHGSSAPAIVPRWASARERAFVAGGWLLGDGRVPAGVPRARGRLAGPEVVLLGDAWIFVGSFLATFAMARGWNEFWLVWIGVDLIGVPLLAATGSCRPRCSTRSTRCS